MEKKLNYIYYLGLLSNVLAVLHALLHLTGKKKKQTMSKVFSTFHFKDEATEAQRH